MVPTFRKRHFLIGLALAGSGAAIAYAQGRAGPAQPLQVVELFQSQGCSSCPPANANVMAIARRGEILALSWQVTYWDYLGWKDSFAQPAFTDRQRRYAQALSHSSVWTPQVVINGKGDVVGSNPQDLTRGLARWGRTNGEVEAALVGNGVTVTGGKTDASVYLVRYDPRVVQVPIRAGENGGRTLPHINIVREYVALGSYSGGTRSYAFPAAKSAGLKNAVLVQAGSNGGILAAVHN